MEHFVVVFIRSSLIRRKDQHNCELRHKTPSIQDTDHCHTCSRLQNNLNRKLRHECKQAKSNVMRSGCFVSYRSLFRHLSQSNRDADRKGK